VINLKQILKKDKFLSLVQVMLEHLSAAVFVGELLAQVVLLLKFGAQAAAAVVCAAVVGPFLVMQVLIQKNA
jgi:hypothetical protein